MVNHCEPTLDKIILLKNGQALVLAMMLTNQGSHLRLYQGCRDKISKKKQRKKGGWKSFGAKLCSGVEKIIEGCKETKEEIVRLGLPMKKKIKKKDARDLIDHKAFDLEQEKPTQLCFSMQGHNIFMSTMLENEHKSKGIQVGYRVNFSRVL